ncbi:MAG: hypothetical protein COU52_02780 [Candidatus Omnitrophica bacterium CG10_big_fil_rev_8_21_14_0_10_43_8]|nr:MAG: hypothetical protein COU52_02780 [Candidatus Omnitrophica bacterium CG10_big_fil_rev_8_21_14_0_10_43_8]
MTRRVFFFLIFLLAITLPAFARPSSSSDFLILLDITAQNNPDSARITIYTNKFLEYVDYELQDGSGGIVFDPTEPLYVNIEGLNFDKSGIISGMKFAKSAIKQDDLPEVLKAGFYPLDYLVINLKLKSGYRISQRANMIVLDIGNTAMPLPSEFVPSFTLKPAPVPKKEVASGAGLLPEDIAAEFIKTKQGKKQDKKKEKKSKKKQEPLVEKVSLPLPALSPQEAVAMDFKRLREEILSRSLSGKPSLKLPQGRNVLGFNQCVEIGTTNFLPLVIAEEEMRLGDMKINEAKRGIYPTATAKYTTTDGETLGVEFTEKSYGMQVEQPLYYGGRLKLTLKQAQINRQVAQSKFDKAEADVVSKITEAFYGLATAQLNLEDQKELFVKSKEMLALAEKKYNQDLTTKLELLNVQSQCNQIDYQLAVAAKDVDIAKISLLQAMGTDPQADIRADMPLDYAENIIDINKCLLLAYQNRPELHMNELLREAAEYEEKIARSKDDFKVDFTGFVGQSGGAYKTEPLNMGSDWYMGFKASKPWLGNTGSYNYTQNKTSPKLGQSTRTGGTSQSLEFGILNNMTAYSEKQSALISKLKAENELVEIEKAINTEVRETYSSYEKAIMQIQNTQEKIRFRQEELNTLKAQSEINEAALSQVLDAMVKLNDEKALYHQAIASYKTALANLNKVVGLIGYFN